MELKQDPVLVSGLEMVLIGSRAMHHWIKKSRPSTDGFLSRDIDYDFVATSSAAFKWIASLGDKVVIHQMEVPLKASEYDTDVEKDISNWKYWNKESGQAYRQSIRDQKMTAISKVTGNTDKIKFEIEIAPHDGNSSANAILRACSGNTIAPLAVLEAIKTAHVVFPRNVRKHLADLHMMRDCLHRKGAYFDVQRKQELTDLIILRRIEHCYMFGVPGVHINLEKTNADFLENESTIFTDKYIAHDDLHLLTCFGEVPCYDNLRTDKSKAMMSKKLFDQASHEIRLNCVKEEAMTIALERYLLPGRTKNAQDAYEQALVRVCTTLTKGWFREYAVNVWFLVKTIDTRKNLNDICKSVMDKYNGRIQEEKQREAELADAKRSHHELLIKAVHETPSWRRQYIFPLIFTSQEELNMANQLFDSVSVGDGYKHCRDYTFDFYWKTESTYDFDNGGWCESFHNWSAYIFAGTAKDVLNVSQKNVSWRKVTEPEWSVLRSNHHGRHAGYNKQKFCVFEAKLSERADDSYSSSPSPDYYPSNWSNMSKICQNDDIVSPDFLMRFMIAYDFPPAWPNQGDQSFPKADFHFMYDAWCTYKTEVDDSDSEPDCEYQEPSYEDNDY